MSFSSDVKTELCSVAVTKGHCQRAELAGIVYMAATLSLGRQGLGFSISTEHPEVVKRTLSLIEKLYGIKARLEAVAQHPKKTTTYVIGIFGDAQTKGILQHLGLSAGLYLTAVDAVYSEIIKRDCCKQAFVRGAFLGGGSIAAPQKRYHIEFVSGSQVLSGLLLDVLKNWGLNAKGIPRKQDYVIYLKESEHIIELLTRLGGYASVLELENIRILKEINNNINRAYNCDTANINRMIAGAEEQIQCIRQIEETIGLSSLSKGLQETAKLRLAYPSASLAELAQLSQEGTSKSGINHRMRKLKEIANSLTPKEE